MTSTPVSCSSCCWRPSKFRGDYILIVQNDADKDMIIAARVAEEDGASVSLMAADEGSYFTDLESENVETKRNQLRITAKSKRTVNFHALECFYVKLLDHTGKPVKEEKLTVPILQQDVEQNLILLDLVSLEFRDEAVFKNNIFILYNDSHKDVTIEAAQTSTGEEGALSLIAGDATDTSSKKIK